MAVLHRTSNKGLVTSLHGLFSPPGVVGTSVAAARDPPVAKLSPHQTHNSSPMYASVLHYVFTMHSECAINANTLLTITPKLLDY